MCANTFLFWQASSTTHYSTSIDDQHHFAQFVINGSLNTIQQKSFSAAEIWGRYRNTTPNVNVREKEYLDT